MSRYIKRIDEDRELIYGYDHALGFFYEIWDFSKGEEDHECLIEDKSSMFGLSREGMIGKMEEYGVRNDHIQKVALDIPF